MPSCQFLVAATCSIPHLGHSLLLFFFSPLFRDCVANVWALHSRLVRHQHPPQRTTTATTTTTTHRLVRPPTHDRRLHHSSPFPPPPPPRDQPRASACTSCTTTAAAFRIILDQCPTPTVQHP